MQRNAMSTARHVDRPLPEIVTKGQVSQWLGVSEQTIEKWYQAGIMPQPMKVAAGRSPLFWFMSEIVEWVGCQRIDLPVVGKPQKAAA